MDRTRSERKDRAPDPKKDSRVERRFVSGLLALALFVALLQALLRFDGVRRYLNQAIRLEGLPLERQVDGLDSPAQLWLDLIPAGADTGTIYLRLLRRPKGEVWILVNSRAVKMLDGEGGPVTVQDGDFLEVLSQSGEVRVLVSGASSNVEFPSVGVWVAGRGNVLVGKVRFR